MKKFLISILAIITLLTTPVFAFELPSWVPFFGKKAVKQEVKEEEDSELKELKEQINLILEQNKNLQTEIKEQKEEVSKLQKKNKDLQNELNHVNEYQLENIDEEENEDVQIDNSEKVDNKKDIKDTEEKKEEIKYLNNYQLKYDNIKGKRITREALKSYIEAQVNLLFAYNNDLDLIDIDTIDEVPEAKSYILNKNELNTYVIELSDKEPKIDYKRIPDELFKFADGNHKTSLNHIIRLIEKYPEYTYKYNSTAFNTKRKIKEQIIASMVTSQDRAQKEDSDLPWTMKFRNDGQTIDLDYKQFSHLTDEEKEFDFEDIDSELTK